MSKKLKPCLFCGGKGGVIKFGLKEYKTLGCLDCGIMMPIYETQEEAIKAWNTRAEA